MLSITDLRPPWLAPHHRCIAYDLRGYGEAPRPAADAPWRLDDQVADLT